MIKYIIFPSHKKKKLQINGDNDYNKPVFNKIGFLLFNCNFKFVTV